MILDTLEKYDVNDLPHLVGANVALTELLYFIIDNRDVTRADLIELIVSVNKSIHDAIIAK